MLGFFASFIAAYMIGNYDYKLTSRRVALLWVVPLCIVVAAAAYLLVAVLASQLFSIQPPGLVLGKMIIVSITIGICLGAIFGIRNPQKGARE